MLFFSELTIRTGPRGSFLLSSDFRLLNIFSQNEHFGIVPLEGMAAGRAVIACNSGGPLESIVDKHTVCTITLVFFGNVDGSHQRISPGVA